MSDERNAARRRAIAGSTLGAGVALVLALVVIVNYFGWKYHQRFDWTASRLYSLSEKSRNVLAELDREIEAVVFMRPDDQLYEPVRELLSRYEAASPLVRVRVVDPEKNLAEAQRLVDQYEIQQLNVVVFDRGDDRRVVESGDLAEYDYSGMQFGQGPEMTGFKGEQLFTSTILDLVESRKPKILFTTGHGEASLDDMSGRGLNQAQDLLGRDNLELEEWRSLGAAAVPEGTDLVVIAGPTASFVAPEVELLRGYLESGGRLLILIDPILEPGGGLRDIGLGPLLAEYGIALGDDIAVDPANPLPFFGAETIFVSSYDDHPITRPLRQAQVPVIFPLARSVRQAEEVAGLEIAELLETTAEGWGERDLDQLDRVEKGDGDLAGPVPLGVAVRVERAEEEDGGAEDGVEELGFGEEGEGAGDAEVDVPGDEDAADGGGEGGVEIEPAASSGRGDLRLAVFGDSDFATDAQLRNVGNATLLANAVNWLVAREELLAIPPKKPEQVRLSLTQAQLRTITWLVLAILPGLAVALGVAVHFRRRR